MMESESEGTVEIKFGFEDMRACSLRTQLVVLPREIIVDLLQF